MVSVFKVPHHEIRFHVSCVQALLNSSRASVMSVIYFNGSGAAQLYCRKTRHNSDIHHGTLVFLNFEINEYIAHTEKADDFLLLRTLLNINGHFNKLSPFKIGTLVFTDKWFLVTLLKPNRLYAMLASVTISKKPTTYDTAQFDNIVLSHQTLCAVNSSNQ